jgi:hypothetical protein
MLSLCNPNGDMDFCEKYDAYLETDLGLNRDQRFQVKFRLKANSHFIWGHDLEKKNSFRNNTLFIWEESHFAQSEDMRPFKFFQNLGISFGDNTDVLKSANNFVLSVSATPFAELKKYTSEPNNFTFLETDSNYNGVQNVLEKKLLIPFDHNELLHELASILQNKDSPPKYGIIRVFKEEISELIVNLAKKFKWNTLRCNSDPKRRDISNLSILNSTPSDFTLIIIKGMCRMGQVIHKPNLSFVMETSADSNAETVLQGLLGRTLGWHNSEVKVYVSNKIIKRGDIDVYLQLLKGDKVLPKKANYAKNSSEQKPSEKKKKKKKIRLVIQN